MSQKQSCILSTTEEVIKRGNIDDLKRHIDKIRENPEDTKHCSGNRFIEVPNLIILACKYNKIETLKFLFAKDGKILCNMNGTVMMPHDLDDSQHNAFYYAIRSSNIEIFKTLITYWPDLTSSNNLEILDDILSKAYDELKLKNIPLSEEIKVFVESQLIDLRFFSNNTQVTAKNVQSRLNNIKERIRFVVENIDLLSAEYSNKQEIDDRFLFLAKCIAQNIYVLKRQLKSTYKSLPWEEIEFCLICFTLSHLTQHKHNVFYHAILNKKKLLKYLNSFSEKLQEETILLDTETCNLPKHQSREDIVANIIRACPQFEELYNDYQQIRDIHSLTKMNEYIELSLEIDPKQKEGQLVITRALTVIGEHTKNTLESPKLSKDTNNLLLFSLSSNTNKVLTGLRNSLTHAPSLFQRTNIENNKDVNFFIGIQQDCEQIRDLIADILYQSKVKIIQQILKEIVNADNFDRIGEMLEALMRFENEIEAKNQKRNIEKLQDLAAELRRTITNLTDYETKKFEEIDDVFVGKESYGSKNQITSNKFSVIFNNLVENSKINKILTKHTAKMFLDNISYDEIYQVHVFRMMNLHCSHIFKSLNSRMQEINAIEYYEIFKIISNIHFIANSGTVDVKFVKEFEKKLNQKNIQKIKLASAKDKFPRDQIDLMLVDLRHELGKWLDSKNITKNYVSYKCDSKLQAVVEVLVLDILNILDDSETCMLENNFLSFSDNSPLLTGKSLRNHLAHDNGLVNLLLSDPSISIVLNANKLIIEDLTSITDRKRLGKALTENLTRVRNNYDWGVAIISNQRKMFNALQSGSFDDFICCLREGADVYARCFRMRTALHFAAIGGCLEIVKYLINQNVSADAKDIHGKTALHVAAEYGRTDIVEYLLKNKKVFIEELTELKETPLHLAAGKGHRETVQLLLDYKASTKIQNVSSLVPLQKAVIHNQKDVVEALLRKEGKNGAVNNLFLLHLASKSGNLDMVEYLLKKGANLRAINHDEETPLHLAARHGHLVVVNFLIKNKAKVNPTNNNGCTPIHLAAENGHVAVVETLIKHGANINVVDLKKNTSLNYAVAGGHEKIVNIFLKNGAKTDLLNANGQSPLHCAVISENFKTINALLKSGVEINLRDRNGHTPLHTLAFIKHSYDREINELLIRNGADINARGRSNSTPLHLAATAGNTELMECLLRHGAEVDARDSLYTTPLHKAVRKAKIDVIKILVKYKAFVYAKDTNGSTPLDCAAAKGYPEIVEYLLESIANEDIDTEFIKSTLINAIFYGQVDVVKVLLKNKYQIKDRGVLDSTVLKVAIDAGHKDIVEILISNGANINQNIIKDTELLCSAVRLNRLEIIKLLVSKGISVKGQTGEPIYEAVFMGHNAIVEYLLENKASLNTKNLDANTSLLELAISRGHKDVVSTLISNGADVNATNFKGITPLHLAVGRRFNEITKILIENGANINEACVNGTPLHIAVEHNNVECVKILINSGKVDFNIKASIEWTTANGFKCYDLTPLHLSVHLGYKEITKIFIDNGASINVKSVLGTPLHIAVVRNDLECVKILINSGKSEINIKESRNYTILLFAAEQNNLEMVEYLVQSGCDISARSLEDFQGSKAIHIAAFNGSKNIVEFLIKKGLSVHDRDSYKNTPLHLASAKGQLEVVKYLISENADLEDRNLSGYTPLLCAATSGHKNVVELLLHNGAMYNFIDLKGTNLLGQISCSEIISLLASTEKLFEAVKKNNRLNVETSLEKGAIINSKNREGFTPLYYATCKGFNDIVGVLIRNKANPNSVYINGFAALHCAIYNKHTSVVQILLSNGANVAQVTDKGNTALHTAVLKNNKEIVDILLQHTSRNKLIEFIDAKTINSGSTALHVAASNNSLDIIKSLLTYGAAYDAENGKGEVACSLSNDQHVTSFLKLIENLFSFVKSGNSEAISILKSLNAYEMLAATTTRNNEGRTLLQVAIVHKRTNIATQLLNILKTQK